MPDENVVEYNTTIRRTQEVFCVSLIFMLFHRDSNYKLDYFWQTLCYSVETGAIYILVNKSL